MKHGLIALGVGCLALAAITCTTSAGNSVESRNVVVFAEQGWQDSGIELTRGQYYRIEARGSWVSGYKHGAHGPEGMGAGRLNEGALLGWISRHRPEQLGYDSYCKEVLKNLVYIGKGGLLKADVSGKLWLAMGEWSGCKECSGNIEVLIVRYQQ